MRPKVYVARRYKESISLRFSRPKRVISGGDGASYVRGHYGDKLYHTSWAEMKLVGPPRSPTQVDGKCTAYFAVALLLACHRMSVPYQPFFCLSPDCLQKGDGVMFVWQLSSELQQSMHDRMCELRPGGDTAGGSVSHGNGDGVRGDSNSASEGISDSAIAKVKVESAFGSPSSLVVGCKPGTAEGGAGQSEKIEKMASK